MIIIGIYDFSLLLYTLSYNERTGQRLPISSHNYHSIYIDFAGGSDGKESACNAGDMGDIPWRRKWQPTPVLLPGESHGQMSLVDYNPWGRKELDMTEQVHFRRRQWHPTPVLLPGKSHGWRSLVDYNPWGRKEWDTIERLHFHFHIHFHMNNI